MTRETQDVPRREPLLEVERLSIEFPSGGEGSTFPAVQDLSFTIAAGEIVGLVGESGSGKSLTALALFGLLPRAAVLRANALRFAGRDLTALDERGWRALRGAAIGLVFQEPMTALNPVLTLGAQVVEAIRAHAPLPAAAARRRAVELLELVALREPARQAAAYPHQLSGGQRQRGMLALALAAGPRLLVADEPTTALDPILQSELIDLLARLRAELGLAILLISHDLGLVATLSDRVLVLRGGALIEGGSRDEIFNSPREPYTRELLAALPQRAAAG